MPGVRESTRALYVSTARKFILFIGGDIPACSLTLQHFDCYTNERKRRGLAVDSINIDIRNLKRMFGLAVDYKLLDESPCRNLKRLRSSRKQPVHVSEGDFAKIYGAARQQWLKDVILFAVHTGLRRGELVNLTWDNYDADQHSISVVNSSEHETKTGDERVVPLDDTANRLVLSRLARGTKYIFTGTSGNKIPLKYLTRQFAAACKAAGVPGVMFKSLRSTCACAMRDAGAKLEDVQHILGHANAATTLKYYAGSNAEARKQAAQGLTGKYVPATPKVGYIRHSDLDVTPSWQVGVVTKNVTLEPQVRDSNLMTYLDTENQPSLFFESNS
jgi:integrase